MPTGNWSLSLPIITNFFSSSIPAAPRSIRIRANSKQGNPKNSKASQSTRLLEAKLKRIAELMPAENKQGELSPTPHTPDSEARQGRERESAPPAR